MVKTKVGIHGACGRMGQRIAQLVHDDAELQVAAALEASSHPKQGADIGEVSGMGRIGIPVTAQLGPHVDVIIDFSTPEATMPLVPVCTTRQIALVVATTGFAPAQRDELLAAAHFIPMLMAPNMSLAVNLLMKLVGQAAAALRDADPDIEIIERHHRFKKDAPSGTALEFGRIITQAAGPRRFVHGREGLVGERPRDEIGFHAVRVSDNVGEHTIIMSLMGETIELTHRAHSRECYARGAVRAAKYLATRKAGLYTMADVLSL
jgi:4-hydroxy-tetrahydrodipicolinate reductase